MVSRLGRVRITSVSQSHPCNHSLMQPGGIPLLHPPFLPYLAVNNVSKPDERPRGGLPKRTPCLSFSRSPPRPSGEPVAATARRALEGHHAPPLQERQLGFHRRRRGPHPGCNRRNAQAVAVAEDVQNPLLPLGQWLIYWFTCRLSYSRSYPLINWLTHRPSYWLTLLMQSERPSPRH